MSCDGLAHILDSDEAYSLHSHVDGFILPHVVLQLLPQVVDGLLLAHALVVGGVVQDLDDVPLQQVLVLADALDEEDPEAEVVDEVVVQVATLLARYVGAIEDLGTKYEGLETDFVHVTDRL